MPLFRSSKKKDAAKSEPRQTSPSLVSLSRRGSSTSVNSQRVGNNGDSDLKIPKVSLTSSPGKIFGRSHSNASSSSLSSPSPTTSPSPPTTSAFKNTENRQVPTIVENFSEEDENENEDDDSVYDTDSEIEMHTHENKYQEKPIASFSSQFSSIMGYCGMGSLTNSEHIKQIANEELKHTYSLLGEYKSFRLDNKDPKASVIGEPEVEVIKTLKARILDIMENNDSRDAFAETHITMLDKYGVVKRVIGRGAYGIIKIVDKSDKDLTKEQCMNPGRKIYAVKELLRRPELNSTFAERALSEFIISASLNNKHLVKSYDLMITLTQSLTKISQVMECTPGGDLFSYMTSKPTNGSMSLDEVDCFIKQIAKGLGYMHNHGVAHCDLKLENVLIKYTPEGGMIIRVSDFGNANVVRTSFDNTEQLYPGGKLGSEPFMCPEEFSGKPFSLLKKDCWAMGIVILLLFRIRMLYYTFRSSTDDEDENEDDIAARYPMGYLWRTTELVPSSKDLPKYKDKIFDEYTRYKMIADYDPRTLDWYVKRKGAFSPIETLFHDQKSHKDIDEVSELRRYILYKLLDLNPTTRMTIADLLDSDWLSGVEVCK